MTCVSRGRYVSQCKYAYATTILLFCRLPRAFRQGFTTSRFCRHAGGNPGRVPRRAIYLGNGCPFHFTCLLPINIRGLTIVNFRVHVRFARTHGVHMVRRNLYYLVRLYGVRELRRAPTVYPIGQVLLYNGMMFMHAVDHVGANVHVLVRSPRAMRQCVQQRRAIRFVHRHVFVRRPFRVGVYRRRTNVCSDVHASNPRRFGNLVPRRDVRHFRRHFLRATSIQLCLPTVVIDAIMDRVGRVSRRGFLGCQTMV